MRRNTVVALLMAGTLLGCQRVENAGQIRYTKTGEFFGSVVRIDVCAADERLPEVETALDAVWERFADIHTRLSVYDPESDLNRVNRAGAAGAEVGADARQLIRDAVGYYELSQGVFDITIAPLIELWREGEKNGAVPRDAAIQAARARMGIDAVAFLPDGKVALRRPDVRINIDSIGDGYAADEAARILHDYGFRNFLVDASGELYAGGMSCSGEKWRVGIRDPRDTSRLLDVVAVTDMAVSTSGNYERYYTIGGKRWSHIINPLTGMPSDDILSASVIAPSAQFADFWSTALCILDPEESARLTDDLGDAYASLVISRDIDGGIRTETSRDYRSYRHPESPYELPGVTGRHRP